MRTYPFLFTGLLGVALCVAACEREASKGATAEKPHEAPHHETSHHETPHHEADERQAEAKDAHAHHHHHAGMEMPAEKPLAGASLYHVESTWANQTGENMQLGSFSGSPVVLAMVYTHCQAACPRIVSDMKAISKGLTEEQRNKTRFVLVSIDPQRDTVQRLAEFAQQASLKAPQWTLLRGDDGAVRELAAVLGVQYRPQPPSDFAHSNLVTILDAQGTIVHQQEGLGVGPEDALRVLSQQLGRPPSQGDTL